ncbi:MAG: InlB B-repeat-containing protein, partial [Peptococcaceae bacterium]|nr:InlB B-repeat-containing protein [Peptococcaceae bacterium]
MKRHITFVALALVFELLLLPVLTGSAAAAPSHFDGPVNTVTVDDASGLNGAISATGSTATHIILGTDFQPGGIVLLAATVTIPANAVIKISGGTLTGDGSGGVVTVQSDAYLELENVTITGGSTLSPSSAGGVTVSGGELVMKSGARISGNTGFWGGGVQVVNSGVFTMNGGSEVSANTATDSGGGVRVSSGGIFTLENGGKISDNLTGNSGGGGVYVGGGYLDPLLAVFTMNGGEISANRTKATDGGGSGGGVQVVNGGAFTLEGGKISENTAYHLGGGGVYVGGGSANLPADFTMNGGEISLNRAATAGGGSEGGGVKVNWGAVFNMNGGKILNNQAEDGNGGGLYSVELYSACQPVNYTWSGALNIGSGAVFSGNTAKALYKMTNDHETLYTSVVASGAAFSFPLESAYTDGERLTGFNNFDIGYILGEIIYYPPVYTIRFAPKGGIGQMDPVFVGTSPQGTSPPYTYSLPENRFSRAGYQFTGWLSSADGQEYGDGHVYTGIDRDIILTAQWRYMDSGGAEPPETVTR